MSKDFPIEQMRALMESVAKNKISELLYENEGFRLRIKGEQTTVQYAPLPPISGTATLSCDTAPALGQTGIAGVEATADVSSVTAGEGKCVLSPLVGTFYASAGSGKEPYCTVGQTVHKGDILFIVESMKVMNEVPAELDGVIAEIMLDNGQPVEYGQPVIRLE